MTPNIGLKDRGLGGKGVRGKGTSRFIKNDYGKVPELKVSKIIEKYRHLTKCLEKKKKKKVSPRGLCSRAKNHRKISNFDKMSGKKGFWEKRVQGI